MQSLPDVYMTSGRERENTEHLSSPQVEPNTVMSFPFHLIKSWQLYPEGIILPIPKV